MVSKKIGIDARLLSQTGVGVYIRNLLSELANIADTSIEFYVYIREEDINDVPRLPNNFILRTTSARWHSISEQTVFLYQLLKDNLNLMHFTYFSMPLFYSRPFVITIHDVIPFNFATGKASTKNQLVYRIKHAMYKKVLTNAVTKAMKIFVPTDAVKNDIQKLFPLINTHTIVRTYEGIDAYLMQAKPSKPSMSIEEPYFLYMGNYYPHKNVEFLVSTFSQIEGAHLILCGPNDYFAKKIDALISSTPLKNKVLRISTTSIGERAYLYTHALALVHPSKNEGFGLPLLEAAHFNCPAIVSDIPVFREIRPQALFFQVSNTEELVSLLNGTIKKGGKKSTDEVGQEFSFNKMTKETYNQYKQCL